MPEVKPQRTFQIVVYWQEASEYRTSKGHWSTRNSIPHEITVYGHHLPNGRFKIDFASAPSIIVEQLPLHQRGLITVIRNATEKLLGCRAILQSEDTDFGSTLPKQGRPSTKTPKYTQDKRKEVL